MDFHQPLFFSNETPALIVGVLDNEQALSLALSKKPYCDVLELRLDHLALDFLRKNTLPLPLLLTCRRGDEGGEGSIPDTERSKMLESVSEFASAVDIEVRSFDTMAETRKQFSLAKIPIIASAHDFKSVPPDSDLEESIRRATDGGASVCKIAATPNSLEDVCRLARLLEPGRFAIPMSVMGMGKFGRATRLLFAQAGSVLNYGYLTEATVPGQWPAEQLRKLLNGDDL